jgi:hypothetical protein
LIPHGRDGGSLVLSSAHHMAHTASLILLRKGYAGQGKLRSTSHFLVAVCRRIRLRQGFGVTGDACWRLLAFFYENRPESNGDSHLFL